jgi:glutamyl-tRNA reductase
MHYITLSFTHKNTALEVREKLAFNSEEKLLNFYHYLDKLDSINETILLSTCNRVEIILSVNNIVGVGERVYDYLADFASLDINLLRDSGEMYEDGEAVHHLFSVVSSLDSLVIGETQIVGQVKDAFKFSYDNGFSGQKMARVMHHAFRCAAMIRNSTDISKNPISVASVAVSKAKEIFGGNLGGYSAVIVGAGEMSTLAAKHLAKAGANLIIVNRDLEKAYKLAEHIEDVTVVVEPFSELAHLVNRYRLLFSATAAPDTIINKEMVKEATFQRHWFDLAVPRDIEDCQCENIAVYAVDDLQDIMNENLKLREQNAKIAYKIIAEFTEEFFKWLQTLSVDPLIKEIRDIAQSCSDRELQKAIKKGYLPKEHEASMRKVLHQAFNAFLHEPTKKLKNVSELPQSDTVVQSIQLFFGLNAQQRKALDTYKCDYQIEKDLKPKDSV